MNLLLLQFAREPVPGAVKTRMMPPMSAEEASELHSELVLWTAGRLLAAELGTVELAVTGASDHPVFQHCRTLGVAAIRGQQGADLGERMCNALEAGLQRCPRVILVGSDCPQIDGQYLQQAVHALDDAEVVLGPALDGGYVLVGVRRLYPGMFEGIPWGSDRVLSASRQRLAALDAHWVELSPLSDIDRPADLALWESIRSRQ